jgi:hypothetical protein
MLSSSGSRFERLQTYNSALQLRGFTVKDIAGFDTMIDHSYRTIEEAHQVTMR